MMNFDAWGMFLSQFKVLHWSDFVGWNRWLEKMVGTNGKVGPNPCMIDIHRIYLSDGWKKRQTYLQ
jgi:hypothetical protein